MLLGHDRAIYRQIFFEVWKKMQNRELILEPMEQHIVNVIRDHPEYHAILANPEEYETFDFPIHNTYDNPFLHLSSHISLLEQLQLDRPHGLRACYQNLLPIFKDEHVLQHQIMDIIASYLWEAIQHQREINEVAILSAIQKLR